MLFKHPCIQKGTKKMDSIPAKHIVTNRKTPGQWFGTDFNMNIYRGCSHGCIYCDSRSACYGIEDFDTVHAKEDALRIIRDDLRRKTKKGVVGMGAMSDPYNPQEEHALLTRHALELIDAFEFGVTIATKSDLILRDMDILQSIARHSPVLLKITITAAEDSLCGKVEPHAPASSLRFEAIRRLSEAGLFAGILLMPVLPFIEDTDENILAIVEKAAQSGARFIYPAFGMTLRDRQRDYYYGKLIERFPQERLIARYQARYGSSYMCTSPRAQHLWEIFAQSCREKKILYDMKDITCAYKRGYGDPQLTLQI